MKSITLRGKDKKDLETQLWKWKSSNPKAVITKQHPIEHLVLDMKKPVGKYAKLEVQDSVSMRIYYNE